MLIPRGLILAKKAEIMLVLFTLNLVEIPVSFLTQFPLFCFHFQFFQMFFGISNARFKEFWDTVSQAFSIIIERFVC